MYKIQPLCIMNCFTILGICVDVWEHENEKLHNFYHLPNIIRVTEPRRVTWAVHVYTLEMRYNATCKSENMKWRYIFGDWGMDESIILKWVLKK
jgi:hypothetical protein